MQPTISYLALLLLLLERRSVRIASASGWFFQNYPPVVEFGMFDANDVICFRKKILDGAHSPQLMHFRHPMGSNINYIVLESTNDRRFGFRTELMDGAIGTSFVQLEVYATYSWLIFRTDVFVEMRCTPVAQG